MARRKSLTTKDQGTVHEEMIFYLNETSVGERGQNTRKSDIELVQFLLRQYYKRHPELFKLLPKTRTNATKILIDGIVGSQTIGGIHLFQSHQKKRGLTLQVVDGLVSVSHDQSAINENLMSTILKLNMACRKHNPEINMARLEDEKEIVESAPHLRFDLS